MSDNEERWDSLPDEILTHIFLSLHIKSIIICTSVSKTWNSLIQNPTFISIHLHHSYTSTNTTTTTFSSSWSHNQLILNPQLTTKKSTYCIKKMMVMVSLKNSPGLNPVIIYSVWWVLATACSTFPMIYSISTLTGFFCGNHVLESFSNFLIPMLGALHTLTLTSTPLLVLDLIPQLMIIKW